MQCFPGESMSVIPPCPEDVIPDRERERLDLEIYAMLDAGALDPENDVIE